MVTNCQHYFEECDCECHTDPGVMHCAPCCDTCPKCGAHIKFGYYDQHIATCGQLPTEFPICKSISELCDCEYHQSSAKCTPPCCKVCPKCGFHIKEAHFNNHLKNCPGKTGKN